MAKLDVNNYLIKVGNFGLYQWVSLILCGLLVTSSGAQMFASVFTRVAPQFRCDDEDFLNVTVKSNLTYDNKCSYVLQGVNKTCSKFQFNVDLFKSTVRTKWSLVCHREYLDTMIGMVFMACIGIGAVIGSYLSDLFGRKPVILVTNVGTGIFGIALSFSPTFTVYVALKVMLGLVNGCAFTVASTLMMESVAPNKRSHAMNGLELFWIFGSSSLSLVAYVFREWWQIQLFISVPSIVTGILSFWFVYESPHWLQLRGKTTQALMVLGTMARWNRCDTGSLQFKQESLAEGSQSSAAIASEELDGYVKGENCCHIWYYRRLLVRFFVLSIGWISCSLCYYALSLGVADLAGNIFINNFIMSAVEGLAYVFCFSVAILGRKWPAISMYFLGGVGLLASTLIIRYYPTGKTYVTVLSLVGKFSISAAWQCIIVWGNELYPTTLRCTLSSINSVVGKIGSVIAPFLIDLKSIVHVSHEDVIMPSVFVVMMIGAGILHLIPPETNKRTIPATLEEANVASFPLVNAEPQDTRINSEDDNERTALLS